MKNDAKRIVVTEGLCSACSTQTIHVHHEDFPELRVEGMTAEQAALHLAGRLAAALDSVPDFAHREAVQSALDDIGAFLNREGAVHLARDLSRPDTH